MKRTRDLITSLDGVGPEVVLTTHDVGAILHCDSSVAADLLATGRVPGGFRVGSRLKIQAKDLSRWIDSEKLPKNPTAASIRERARRAR